MEKRLKSNQKVGNMLSKNEYIRLRKSLWKSLKVGLLGWPEYWRRRRELDGRFSRQKRKGR